MARLVYGWPPVPFTNVWCGALRQQIPGLRMVTNGSTFLMIAAMPSLLMPNPIALLCLTAPLIWFTTKMRETKWTGIRNGRGVGAAFLLTRRYASLDATE